MISFDTQNGYQIKIPTSFHGYNFIKLLGRGGTCIVILVEDQKTQEKFSAKIISKEDVSKRNAYDSVIREINVHKSISHPNIIQFHESFEIQNDDEEEFIVIVMEYCEKGDLLTYVTEYGFKSEVFKKKIIHDFLKAVQYLHSQEISHGDIKADNILLDSHLNPKLCDFGYCRTHTRASDEYKRGTLYYSAPELLKKGYFNTLKADIYAIGITLYTLSELAFPFHKGSDDYVIDQITNGNLSFKYNMDLKLRKLIKKCTDINPLNRPTIDEIINDEYFTNEKKTENPKSANAKVKSSFQACNKEKIKRKWNHSSHYVFDSDDDEF